MNRDIAERIAAIGPSRLSAIEVSGQEHANDGWASYESRDYPEFDLCNPPTSLPTYDVVCCEQVLEHLPDPWRAARTLHDLCSPGGMIVVSVPFLVRVHPMPDDYWRFTPSGLRVLLESAGLSPEVRSWGNASAVRANFYQWAPYWRGRSLKDEPDLPFVVWAFATRPAA
jgi:SAM-dependent methyltransferase